MRHRWGTKPMQWWSQCSGCCGPPSHQWCRSSGEGGKGSNKIILNVWFISSRLTRLPFFWQFWQFWQSITILTKIWTAVYNQSTDHAASSAFQFNTILEKKPFVKSIFSIFSCKIPLLYIFSGVYLEHSFSKHRKNCECCPVSLFIVR